MIPKVIASCWSATKLPRTSGGASSALRRARHQYLTQRKVLKAVYALVQRHGHTERSDAQTGDKPACSCTVSHSHHTGVEPGFSPPKIEDGWKAVVWTITPMQNTTTAILPDFHIQVSTPDPLEQGHTTALPTRHSPLTIVYFRDSLSARYPLTSTPNHAPSSRIATSQPWVPGSVASCPIRFLKDVIFSTPENTP